MISDLSSVDEIGSNDSKPTSTLSIFTDDGLDITMGVNESLFIGPDIDPDCSAIVNGKFVLDMK